MTIFRANRNLKCPGCGKSRNVLYRPRQHNYHCARKEGCGRVFTRAEVERMQKAEEAKA
jgi:uncharacterized Zn finger protein